MKAPRPPAEGRGASATGVCWGLYPSCWAMNSVATFANSSASAPASLAQPWPFPYSLMIGCYGEALTETIVLDEEELADARWFSRDHVRRALVGNAEDLAVPGKLAIARYLIEKWATG